MGAEPVDSVLKIADNLYFALPEVVVFIGIVVLIIIETSSHKSLYGVSRIVFGFVCIAYIYFVYQQSVRLNEPAQFFNGLFHIHALASVAKIVLGLFSLAVLSFSEKNKILSVGIFYSLLLSLLLGASFLTTANNLLSIYIGIELMSLSGYLLVGFRGTKQGFEVTLKYLLFGAAASGVMLYGLSWLYGLTGELTLSESFKENLFLAPQSLKVMASVFVISGILFKTGAFPFHIWIPDTYQGGRTSVASYLAVIPKLASFIILIRLLSMLSPDNQTNTILHQLLLAASVFTIILGTFAALKQINVRRMLAYSSIAHSGFLLLIAIQNTSTAFTSFLFYFIVYAIANYAIFWYVDLAESDDIHTFKDYAQKNKHPGLAGICATIVMVSLVGLPPTAGFTAKLVLFSSVWAVYNISGDYFLLLAFITGLAMTFIALYYYLKIPYNFFIKRKNSGTPTTSISRYWYLIMSSLILIVLFVIPNLLLDVFNGINFIF